MSYPPPPPGPVPAANGKPRLRGRIPLRLSIIFLVLGIAGIVIGGVTLANGALKKVNEFQRVSVADGSGTLTFGTGKYLAYYEAPNFDTSGRQVPIIEFTLVSATSGTPVNVEFYGNRSTNKLKSLTYDYNGHHGAAIQQFTIDTAGKYKLTMTKGSAGVSSSSDLALGKSIATGLVAGVLILVAGILLLIAGIVLLPIGLVKRSHSKKELAAAQAYYGQQGAYGQPGYGQQPGYAPPGQQQPPAYGAGPTYGAPPQQQGGYPPPGQQQPPASGEPWPPQDHN